MKEIIHTSNAPQAIGPYSQAVKINGFIYVSGQIPVDPATGAMWANQRTPDGYWVNGDGVYVPGQ